MKKGFTLVELLAVITILAIISLIAVPIVINIIEDTKEASLKKSIRFYTDAITKNISNQQTKDPDYEPDECTIQENGNVICSQNGEILNVTETSNELEIPMKGSKPSSGTIKLKDGKVVDIIDLYLEGRYANYNEKGNMVLYLYAFPTEAGLYDGNRKLLATWDELVDYGFNISDTYYYPTNNQFKSILDNNRELKNGKILIISNSVTKIGSYEFYGCTGLTNIIIGNRIISIESNAFYNCTGLTSITIPSSVTSIGNSVFLGCSSLTSIIVESENTKYEDRGSNAIIEKSTNTFIQGCNNSTIPNGVTRIGRGAFSGFTGLTSVTIPNSVISIGNNAFYDCTGLTSVTIPNSVTSIGNFAFYNCTGLTSITIPSSVTSIGEDAFSGCTGLTSITIPNSVTNIGWGAFSSCTGLTSIMVDVDNTAYEDRGGNVIIEKSTNTLIQGCSNSTIPNGVTRISDSAFWGCSSLTSITIPNSVTRIDHYAFAGCTGLTSVTFENISGWFTTNSFVETSGTNMNVTNASTNATNLKDTYSNYYWKRNT